MMTPMETGPAPKIPDHEVLRQIGGGSYGVVWLARNVTTGAYRAVKVVCRSTFEHERPYEREFAGLQKFEPISRAQQGLMAILHVGRNAAEDYFYSVMELADDQETGQEIVAESYTPKTLRSELWRRGRLPLDECLQIGTCLALALEHLHRHGLVHRDIKPSNIIFINGTPKLADIGLVAGLEATRSCVGTEGYVPPEGPGTPQGDLYSLGKVLYEMSTGRDRLDYPELPAGLREFPDYHGLSELNEVIIRACEPEPSRRYRSAGEARSDLEQVRNGKSVRQRHLLERRRLIVKRAVAAATALAALLGLGASLYLLGTRRPARQPEPERVETIEGSGYVEVRSDMQHVLWTTNLGDVVSRADVIDDGSDHRTVLVATRGEGKDSGGLFAFDRAGKLRWHYPAPPTSYYRGGSMGVFDFAFIPGNEEHGPRFAVACRNSEGWSPSCLVVLDSTGCELGRYWHPGHIQMLRVGSETAGASQKVIVWAFNNRLREKYGVPEDSSNNVVHCVFLLDPANVSGEAPPYVVGTNGTHEWYLVFLPPGLEGVSKMNLVDVNGDGKMEIGVWVRNNEFYFKFDGQCIQTNQGDVSRGTVGFLHVR